MCSAPNFTVLYFLIQSFPEQAIHVSGLCFVSATGLCDTYFCFFDICVDCGHRKESPDLVCVSCDKSTKMDGTDHSEELYLQRLNALCRLCGRRSNKAFDDRKIILCKTYATELSAFHQIVTLSDSIHSFRNIM